MKLQVLAALLASCDAVHQESNQHQLVATNSKLSNQVKADVKSLQQNSMKNKKMIGLKDKVGCENINPMMLQIQAQAKAQAKKEAACGDDSCCGCCCCSSQSSVPVYSSPSHIQIPGIPNPSGCPSGYHMYSGSCTADIIKDTLPPNCPKGFSSDGYGNCLPTPASFPTSSPLVTCAYGYYSDGKGNCIGDTFPSPVCPSGYKSDGNGNCVISFEPIICGTGFISNGSGSCIPAIISTSPICPSGYFSDGQGNCLPNVKSEVTCANGFTSDGEGNCIWVSVSTVPSYNPSLPATQQVSTPTPVPIPSTPSCPSGFNSDGFGNCVASSVPVICGSGYVSDGYGNCAQDTSSFVSSQACPSGQYSDGDGNCLPDSVSVSCQSGWESDNEGGCIPLPSDTPAQISSPQRCPDRQQSDGAGGCIPMSVQLSCASGYLKIDSSCVSMPSPVPIIPSSNPRAVPGQDNINDLQAQIAVLESVLAKRQQSSFSNSSDSSDQSQN